MLCRHIGSVVFHVLLQYSILAIYSVSEHSGWMIGLLCTIFGCSFDFMYLITLCWMTLSVARTIGIEQCYSKFIVSSNDCGRRYHRPICKDGLSICPERLGNPWQMSQVNWSEDWDLNLGRPNYEARMLFSIMIFFRLMLQTLNNWMESLTHWLLGIVYVQTPVWLLFKQTVEVVLSYRPGDSGCSDELVF